jgi:hypothetical protein
MSELTGRVLAGRYRLESLIGRGGMADVYRGTDTMLERPVAVKILTDRSEGILRRFLREAQSMARLNHPHIVAVFDAGQTDGLSYIVMELMTGRTLEQIPAGELTMHVAIRYFMQLLEGLAYAHDASVIHRDVKPANIMVGPDGNVKVMDFGLSRRTSEMSSETNAGEIVGTIAYLAPERFLGKVADARSDLYSVGAMMYEIFTGRVPFISPTEDLVGVIFMHVNDVPASLRTINRAVPPQVDRIVLKLLEKDPDLRFATARELIAELHALIGGPPVPASPNAAAPAKGAAPAGPALPERRADEGAAHDAVRNVLERTFGQSAVKDSALSSTLAGMLAARKGDYHEAIRTYKEALRVFKETGNDVEHAKTVLKYTAMILQKNSGSVKADRREIGDAVRMLSAAMLYIRGKLMLRELEEGERVAAGLQRLGLRLR